MGGQLMKDLKFEKPQAYEAEYVAEKNYAKCTFFVLGQNAEYYPEVVKREYELGQQVGTHTYRCNIYRLRWTELFLR